MLWTFGTAALSNGDDGLRAGVTLVARAGVFVNKVNEQRARITRGACRRGRRSVSCASRWVNTPFNFVRDWALGEPRSPNGSLLHSQHMASGTLVCEPCVTRVQRHLQHPSKLRGGVRTVATTHCPQKCCQRAFLPRHHSFSDFLTGDGVSHAVSICDELLQATLRVDFFEKTLLVSVVRRGHHRPHRSVKAWSGALLLAASLNVGRSNRLETVERIIFAASRTSGGNTRSVASGAWPFSRCFFNVWRYHLCIKQTWVGSYQLEIASTWPPYLWRTEVPFSSRCLSSAGLDQPRNHITQIMREIVNVAIQALCSSALFDKVCAHHGIQNTLPTRNHALSHTIFHLEVAGRHLWKHLMKVLIWRWSPLGMSKRFCYVASSCDTHRKSAAESSDKERIYVLPNRDHPHCRRGTVLVPRSGISGEFHCGTCECVALVSDVYRQCVNTWILAPVVVTLDKTSHMRRSYDASGFRLQYHTF